MKEFKGTKGEWIIQSDLSVLIGHECEYLWSYSGRNSNFKHEVLANAKLIAAAPELLEALQKIIEGVDDGIYDILKIDYEKARKAIEKALK